MYRPISGWEHVTEQSPRQVIRLGIDVLPDEVLLGIFDLYVHTMSLLDRGKTGMNAWQSLVHVCGRWRGLVLGSPRHLNLRLFCTPETLEKGTLDVWPSLPLIISGDMPSTSGTDNIVAALGQSNRVCQLILSELADWQLEKVSAAMQMPFPELTVLQLISDCETLPVIPNSFLGESAPRLQIFELRGISFPGLPNLLISATHLVELLLFDIPHSGYISPKAMVTLLCDLSSLEILHLQFRSPRSCPNWESRNLPPLKPCILPVLHEFHFKGVTEYLEQVVTHIYTPQLDRMLITFFNQIDFDCPRLVQFINHSPTLGARDRARDEAHLQFKDYSACVGLPAGSGTLEIAISCREPDWQLSSIEQVCNSSLPLATVQDLYIVHQYLEPLWKNDAIENTLWLQLLLPFTAVKDLYISEKFAPGISAALQEVVGGRITEVLPSLKNIFVEDLEPWGPFQENIGQFAAVRRHSGHPIAISGWNVPSYFTIYTPSPSIGSPRSSLAPVLVPGPEFRSRQPPPPIFVHPGPARESIAVPPQVYPPIPWTDGEKYIPPEPSYSTSTPSIRSLRSTLDPVIVPSPQVVPQQPPPPIFVHPPSPPPPSRTRRFLQKILFWTCTNLYKP